MKKVMIIALILVGALLIPAVSAEVLTDEDSIYATFDLESAGGSYAGTPHEIGIYKIQDWDGLYFVYVKVSGSGNSVILKANPSYSSDVTLKIGSDVVGSGTAHYNALFNSAGDVTGVQLWLEIDSWHPTGYTGTQTVTINSESTLFNGITLSDSQTPFRVSPERPIGIKGAYENTLIKGTHLARSHYYWENVIDISDEFISLTRNLNGNTYVSTLQITSDAGYFEDTSFNDINVPYVGTGTWNVTNPHGRIYSGILGSDTSPGTNDVTVYVRNSQTGALIGNAHLTIEAAVSGQLHHVLNDTVPSGVYQTVLQPTGGGIPNPDYYRATVTLDGYNSQMPYIDFELTDSTSIYVYLEPTTGGPEDDNMTFVEFYIRDIYANPISGASVTCGGYTLTTNSAGYTQFEIPINSSYSYSVEKTGYMTIEGIVTVGTDDRYVVNVALMAGAVPTQTAVTPTITVEPTPTQTTPPIQEDNIIGLSVKGLAKGFGIDYDTALLMFGLMIIFGAGGIVMNSVKGGAMEFIAGSIVGTFVAFALGLIPIWIFIIIAVVFGAYVLRVFVQGGQ